jgi:hypothetical protein
VPGDAVDFLAECEGAGMTIEDCPGYVRKWIDERSKGICPVCHQPVEVIESDVDTLDIHYLVRGDRSKLCPGSGKQFKDYLKIWR